MTYNKFITHSVLSQLSISEKKGLITYFRLEGVRVSNIVEGCFENNDLRGFLIFDETMLVWVHSPDTPLHYMSLDELKLMSRYFHAL